MLHGLIILFVCLVVAQPPHQLKVYSDDFTVGLLNPLTGKVSCATPLLLPNTTCTWTLGSGTRGQTSAIFYMNRTFFFLIQEKCESAGRIALIATFGPYCSRNVREDPLRTRTLGYFPYVQGMSLEDFNVAWDHTCNLVVLTPQLTDNNQFTVNQLSEYDGAQRFQPKYSLSEGWRKKRGAGALDFGNFVPVWRQSQELNCGDQCTFYTVEEQVIDDKAVLPAYIIGRSFRTGTVRLNITDSLQIQSLSWNPLASGKPVNQFLGVGLCCSESWCHQDCHNDNLVLINFSPSTNTLSILSEIGELDATTIELGVEFSPAPFGSGDSKQAYVVHNNMVVTFDLKVSPQGLILSADKSDQSPVLDSPFKIHMWTNADY